MSSIEWSLVATKGRAFDLAVRLASEGAREGTAVTSSKGGRLEVCALLAPAREDNRQLLTLLVLHSSAEGIRKDTGIVVGLRWPRWATFEGRVLAEGAVAAVRGEGRDCIILSVIVNCSCSRRRDSTSLQSILGVKVDRDLLAERILRSVQWTYSAWLNGMDAALRERIEPTVETVGSSVLLVTGSSLVRCTAKGIGADGSLLVDSPRGEMRLSVEDANKLRYRA